MLIFVYNADSGKFNALLDSAHKILSPGTYECQLCQLSYGVFSENKLWKSFRESLDEEVVFLHRDEFEQQYPQKFTYPVLLRQTDEDMALLLKAEDFDSASDAAGLIELCRKAIA